MRSVVAPGGSVPAAPPMPSQSSGTAVTPPSPTSVSWSADGDCGYGYIDQLVTGAPHLPTHVLCPSSAPNPKATRGSHITNRLFSLASHSTVIPLGVSSTSRDTVRHVGPPPTDWHSLSLPRSHPPVQLQPPSHTHTLTGLFVCHIRSEKSAVANLHQRPRYVIYAAQ